MNLSRQLVRQTAQFRRCSKTVSSARSLTTVCLRQQRFPLDPLRPVFLRPCSLNLMQLSKNRQASTEQSCKFEVINVQDEDDFKKRVLESDKPVIVDFHATWCGPCRLLGPRLEKLLSDENGKVVMAKVDIDDNSDLAMEYGVRSVPTVLGMKDGKVQSQFVGLIDDDQIQTFVDKLVVS